DQVVVLLLQPRDEVLALLLDLVAANLLGVLDGGVELFDGLVGGAGRLWVVVGEGEQRDEQRRATGQQEQTTHGVRLPGIDGAVVRHGAAPWCARRVRGSTGFFVTGVCSVRVRRGLRPVAIDAGPFGAGDRRTLVVFSPGRGRRQ